MLEVSSLPSSTQLSYLLIVSFLLTQRSVLDNSLTPSVLTEALSYTKPPTSLIIAYHPPIFKPLSSLTLANPLQSSLLQCAARGISVYTPHTALDSVWGGINDWLAEGVLSRGEGEARVGADIRTLAGEKSDLDVGQGLSGGEGRLVTLEEPIQMGELESRILGYLHLSQRPSLSCLRGCFLPPRSPIVQVSYATPTGSRPTQGIRTVAICAGSGGSMLLGQQAD